MQIRYRLPPCHGLTRDNGTYSFDTQAGRNAVVILIGTLPPEDALPLCAAFQSRREDLDRWNTDLILLADAYGLRAVDVFSLPIEGVTTVLDSSDFFTHCGFDHSQPMIVLIDQSQRVLAAFGAQTNIADTVDAICAILRSLPTEGAREVVLPAPVLLIPNIFDPAFCRQLIDTFEQGDHRPGGMASVDALGQTLHRIDADKKKREDYVVEPGSELCNRIVATLSEICVPEMKKAFQFEAGYMDRVLIARYDDTGGYFRRHRDNVAPSVAFRQFALSVNLNTEAYEGGHLLFPEYNGHRYRPATGGGIVFSASLLHEAAPVTKGSRYVLLTFFHNAESQARRVAA